MQHIYRTYKDLAACLTTYNKKKFLLFQGKEGAQRIFEFSQLLSNLERDGTPQAFKVICTFYLSQKASSLLRNIIKDTLLKIFNIEIPRLSQHDLANMSPYVNPQTHYKNKQEQALNKTIGAYLLGKQFEEIELPTIRVY